jgi:hypothetical protein
VVEGRLQVRLVMQCRLELRGKGAVPATRKGQTVT